MKNIGKPYEGKLHVRFDEEGLNIQPFTLVQVTEKVTVITRVDLIAFMEGLLGESRNLHGRKRRVL
ncbi:hypothetical protein ASG85_26545 [Paenibacillus sp. Soil724D2]|nr:hypothetical protein ASG85_26545 [Paenibacillus sp. Soil724D2]